MLLPRARSRVVLGAFGLLLTVPAFAAPRFVAPLGVDAANSCTSLLSPCATVQHAVDVALPGDSIEITPFVYNQRLRVESKTNLTFHALADRSSSPGTNQHKRNCPTAPR